MHAESKPDAIPAVTPASGWALNYRGLLGPIAVALALMIAGFAYIRRRRVAARDQPQIIPPIEARNGAATEAHSDSTPDALHATGTFNAATPRAAAASPAVGRESAAASATSTDSGIHSRMANGDTLQNLAVRSVKLETSADNWGNDASLNLRTEAFGTATLETAKLDTVAIDTSDLEVTLSHPDLNTAILATSSLDATAIDSMLLDYNLLDLDATAQHVHMPSKLHDHAVITERRTNIVDVLKSAISRDPNRRDLRMKLLETYYSVAASNQKGFMEIVRKLAREREFLSAEDWEKIAIMGRDIAADDPLFTVETKDDDLANCA